VKPTAILLVFSVSMIFILNACDDNSTDNGEDYIRPAIQQPLDGDTLRDSVYTIRVDAEQNCGCSSWVAFYVDDTLLTQDWLRPFACDIECDNWQGDRTIKVHAVVPGSSSPNGIKAEGWDSVRVTIDLTK
jgi:hypothetical protein